MGAIYGLVTEDIPVDACKSALHSMADFLDFRGNATAFFVDAPVAFGVSAHEHEQPAQVMVSPGGEVIAVCEGEMYNRDELASLVGDTSAQAADQSGFFLVPELYLKYGREFAVKINGVFTLALWDTRHKRLLLYRDHLGSHSIFYHQQGARLFFSSTIKSLLSLQDISTCLDIKALNLYFANLSITPPATLYKNISALRPGHGVMLENGKCEEFSYWPFDEITEEYELSADEHAARIREIFEDAVRIRAIGKQTTGVLVSGGVDTSAVVAALCRGSAANSLLGFSIAFKEKEFSDAPLQKILYESYPVKRHAIVLGPDQFASGLARGASFLDSPVNDTAFSGMLTAFKAAATHGCVAVFEGEGSDEIFCTSHSRGEYDILKFLRIPEPLRRIACAPFIGRFSEGARFRDKAVRLLARIGMSDLQRRCSWVPVFSPSTRKRLLGGNPGGDEEQLFATAQEYYNRTRLRDPLNIYQYGLTRLFLADDLLYKNERMAAAAGLVNRTPFTDYRLVEIAFKVPAKYKMQPVSRTSDGTKLIFKKAVRGLVPDAILDRKKSRGFSQPTAVWYRHELKDFVQDHLLSGNAHLFSVIDRREVRRICSDFMEGKIENDYFVNSLLILELWMRAQA